jgi:hypothetical protein
MKMRSVEGGVPFGDKVGSGEKIFSYSPLVYLRAYQLD